MGPVVDRQMQWLRLRPFKTSKTYANLARSGRAVFHVTDDCLLLVRAALGTLAAPPMMVRVPDHGGQAIQDACRWYALEVHGIDDANDRAEIECAVVQSVDQRPFLGWNRAMHSVLEAAILATRLHLLPQEEVLRQLATLRGIVRKTASQREHEAFAEIVNFVDDAFRASNELP